MCFGSALRCYKDDRLWCIDPRATLQWRHNDYDSVSNDQPHGCLLNRLFRRSSKQTSKLRVTGLCVGNSPGPVNSPHKGPVTRKTFPFDDVIMIPTHLWVTEKRLLGHSSAAVSLTPLPVDTFLIPSLAHAKYGRIHEVTYIHLGKLLEKIIYWHPVKRENYLLTSCK